MTTYNDLVCGIKRYTKSTSCPVDFIYIIEYPDSCNYSLFIISIPFKSWLNPFQRNLAYGMIRGYIDLHRIDNLFIDVKFVIPSLPHTKNKNYKVIKFFKKLLDNKK